MSPPHQVGFDEQLSFYEQEAQFLLWCVVKAPLLMSFDPAKPLDKRHVELLTNPRGATHWICTALEWA